MNEVESRALAPDRASPGRILAAARAERGMSVPEVAQRLKFSLRHIEALEADRYDVFPPGPYVRGMMRTYAKLLGLDPAPLLDALPGQSAGGEEAAMEPRDMSVPFPHDGRPGSRVYLLLSMLVIVAVAVVLAEWFIRGQRSAPPPEDAPASLTGDAAPKAEPLPDPVPASADAGTAPAGEPAAPPALQATLEPPAGAEMAKSPPAPAAPTLAAALPAPGPAAETAVQAPRDSAPVPRPVSPGQSRLQLRFELESWVEIKDASGDVILSALNAPGTEKEVVGTGPFSLVIGNASGVRLTHNGEPVTLAPHRNSDVARLTVE